MNCCRAVKLFREDDSRDSVCEGECRQAETHIGLAGEVSRETVGAANDECYGAFFFGSSFGQQFGQLLAAHLFAVYFEGDGIGFCWDCAAQISADIFTFAQFDFVEREISADSRVVVVDNLSESRFFDFADGYYG